MGTIEVMKQPLPGCSTTSMATHPTDLGAVEAASSTWQEQVEKNLKFHRVFANHFQLYDPKDANPAGHLLRDLQGEWRPVPVGDHLDGYGVSHRPALGTPSAEALCCCRKCMPMVQSQELSVERSLLAATDNVAAPQAAEATVVEVEQQSFGAPPPPGAESVAAEPAVSQAKAAHKAVEAKWAHVLQVREKCAQQLKRTKGLTAVYEGIVHYEDKQTTEQCLSGFKTACCPPCSASVSAKEAYSTAEHLRSMCIVGQHVQ